jgi:hypothetical protein
MLQCCHIVLCYETLDQNRPVCWSIVVKEKPTVDSPFPGVFSSDRIPTTTKDVNVHFYIQRINSCKLYQRIPRTFGSYCVYVWLLWMSVFHIDNRPSIVFVFRASCTYSQLHHWTWRCWNRQQQRSTMKAGVGTSFLSIYTKCPARCNTSILISLQDHCTCFG